MSGTPKDNQFAPTAYPSASSCRTSTQAAISRLIDGELKEIFNAIDAATQRGEYEVRIAVKPSLSKMLVEIEKYLHAKGFQIDSGGIDLLIVSWEEYM